MRSRTLSKHTDEELRAWDNAHVWHPFTPHSVYDREHPLFVRAGEGNYLIDVDGTRYLDGVGSLWCNLFGHRKKQIDQAIHDQLDRIAHATMLGNSSTPAVVLAKRLIDLAPGTLSRVFFSDNGSTSVEVALKMALQYWQQCGLPGGTKRTRFLSFAHAYHGDTIGAVSVGGIDLFHERFRPMIFDALHAPSPSPAVRPSGVSPKEHLERSIQEFDRLLSENADELCAVILEPGFQGAAGILTLQEGFLRHVRTRTREEGVLLILDEVAAGMGRSGSMFACEREDVVPDFLCVAKGLTGGYLPLAATITHDQIYDAFLGDPAQGRTFFHGHTYTGNALGAAAALATLDVFEDEDILGHLAEIIPYFEQAIGRLSDSPFVRDVRSFGLAAGIELMSNPDQGGPFSPEDRVGMKVCTAARQSGVFLRPLGDVIVYMPPLSITKDQIDDLVDATFQGIRTVLGAA